ncbi:MAG: hypothetical protein EP343_21905 [Deltaproteobacteria bacterium]|nr:MAG: hypothetical protein EP343_21905 [Deltaproteobacteria bacterium]
MHRRKVHCKCKSDKSATALAARLQRGMAQQMMRRACSDVEAGQELATVGGAVRQPLRGPVPVWPDVGARPSAWFKMRYRSLVVLGCFVE